MAKSRVSWRKRLADLLRRQQTRPARPHEFRDSKILTQVKFYFSDANLRRDTYMHRLFAADPYGWITFQQLKQFPQLRKMEVSAPELASIVRRCDFFVLDDTNGRIRRDFNLYPNREVQDQLASLSTGAPNAPSRIEKRTVYMEDLPLNFTHEDTSHEVHSQLPQVEVKYVSIPRHPVTGESFGCAIVELGSEEQASIVVSKLRRVETEKFDAVSGKLGRTVRVMTFSKYKALRRLFMQAKSLAPINRLSHFPGYVTDDQEPRTEEDDSSVSSILDDSDVNSLAQDSVEVRRNRNASSIRSNSLVRITGLPPTTSISVRIWLSHSAAVQFLDYKEGDSRGVARFASKSERDFFLLDFSKSQLEIHGVVPQVRAMTEDECLEYFDNERERRRAQCLAMGPPDLWDSASKRPRLTEDEQTSPKSQKTKLKIIQDPRKGHCAFTDTVAGNPKLGEPGTSMLFGIEKGRHVARKFLTESVSEPMHAPKRQRTDQPHKKTRRGTRGGRKRIH
jgi:hypothetical protein